MVQALPRKANHFILFYFIFGRLSSYNLITFIFEEEPPLLRSKKREGHLPMPLPLKAPRIRT